MAPIASLFVCALLVGWFAPNLPTQTGGDEAHADLPEADAQLAAHRTDQWLAGQTVLRRESDGHFYADASVDGAQLRFLVDTGASIVALTGDDASAIGLSWDEASLRPIGRGASGTVRGIPVRLERLEIDGLEARNFKAAIIPEGLDVSLLGQSFLSKVQNVEISGNEMTLGG